MKQITQDYPLPDEWEGKSRRVTISIYNDDLGQNVLHTPPRTRKAPAHTGAFLGSPGGA